MKRARHRAWLAGCTAIALLALPAAASASHSYVAQTPGKVVKLSVHGSHGFRILVTNAGAKKRVILAARKGDARAVYSVHGRANANRIEGNFGKLGKISVRFQPSSRKPERRQGHKDCKGKPTTVQAGRFVGRIKFAGEEGFTSASVTSAQGTVESKYKLVCTVTGRPPTARQSASTARQSAEEKHLSLQSSEEKHFTFIDKDFVAVAADHDHSVSVNTINTSSLDEPVPDGYTLGEAATTEHRGRIKIGRSVELETEVDPVQASPLGAKPLTATITLPAPLEGTGSYVENPGSPPSWSGDIRVRLPGGGTVPLTGPEFKAVLCHGVDGSEKLQNCEGKFEDLFSLGFRYPLYL
jgi:hypothetical protein